MRPGEEEGTMEIRDWQIASPGLLLLENGVGETRAVGSLCLATIAPKSLAFLAEHAEKSEYD